MQRRRLLIISCVVLFVLGGIIWYYALAYAPDGKLTVAVMDIGQGDSILVRGPTGIEMLVDGGPDQSVLRKLPEVIGPFDRTLNLVVETHPDSDHITGLVSVFDRYRVGAFMEPNRPDTTMISKTLLARVVAKPGLMHVIGRAGQRINLGGGAYADILSPAGDVAQIPTNNASIVMHVVYGKTSFMLTGDAPSPIEDYLVGKHGDALKSDILKAGHHGSKFSSDDLWLATVHPSVVAISAGLNNRYGHPAPATISRIQNEGANIVSTIESGTLTFVSDGQTFTERGQK